MLLTLGLCFRTQQFTGMNAIMFYGEPLPRTCLHVPFRNCSVNSMSCSVDPCSPSAVPGHRHGREGLPVVGLHHQQRQPGSHLRCHLHRGQVGRPSSMHVPPSHLSTDSYITPCCIHDRHCAHPSCTMLAGLAARSCSTLRAPSCSLHRLPQPPSSKPTLTTAT